MRFGDEGSVVEFGSNGVQHIRGRTFGTFLSLGNRSVELRHP
jgi:hypothetical protein